MPMPFPISAFLWQVRIFLFSSMVEWIDPLVCAQGRKSSTRLCESSDAALQFNRTIFMRGHALVEAPDFTDFINGYSGRIITGFEMRGGSQGAGPSKIMGAEGNPPLALRRSIDKGMAANNAGRHVNYLQIYEGDVLSADMQPVLQYAASLFPRP